MAQSSDEIIKREIIDTVGHTVGKFKARVFNEGSNDDQRLFSEGGLTFTADGQDYGSCDVAYVYKSKSGEELAAIAIEGTDCLGRGSSGNAQYQRFHHALGAVKSGVIGVYYLREGKHKIQEDLYGMAYNASKSLGTPYLVIQDLGVLKTILELKSDDKYKVNLKKYIDAYQEKCYQIYLNKFNKTYNGSWQKFADKRSTILADDNVIKYSSRNIRNFTEGSQRAGHIAVGEMFLTKYFFPEHIFHYLMPRLLSTEMEYLDINKKNDKEWSLLRNEPNVYIRTLDDLVNLPKPLHNFFISNREKPIKGEMIKKWNLATKELHALLKSGTTYLKNLEL